MGKIGYRSSDVQARVEAPERVTSQERDLRGRWQVELLTPTPPPDVILKLTAIEGLRIAPAVLTTQEGPDHHLGPEAAGAVLILQGTFVDEHGAAGFFRKAAELFERVAVAPGFIRRFSFADGPHGYSIQLWRTAADAHAFFTSDEHEAAMRELFQHRWAYSHFAALWEMTTPRQRVIFCQWAASGRIQSLTVTPALAMETRVALTLRMVGGLTVPEIARAFLVQETTMGQRITRAKAKIKAARIPYRVPSAEDLPARVSGVLAVLFLIFNEGYLATGPDTEPVPHDLTAEAIRLTRLIRALMPEPATGRRHSGAPTRWRRTRSEHVRPRHQQRKLNWRAALSMSSKPPGPPSEGPISLPPRVFRRREIQETCSLSFSWLALSAR